jgi:hypothetical protein
MGGERAREHTNERGRRDVNDPFSFIGYYDRGKRESERVCEQEREKRRMRERRARRKHLHCKKTT